jgi:hypothetical protein
MGLSDLAKNNFHPPSRITDLAVRISLLAFKSVFLIADFVHPDFSMDDIGWRQARDGTITQNLILHESDFKANNDHTIPFRRMADA